ncbi:MAG: HDOD domain-containing protein [Pseudomonadota bacterium]
MSPEDLAAEVDQLTSFPDIAYRISDLLDDEHSSAWDIGALIEQDPALTSALLRLANSAFYNSGVPVNVIDRAVTVVGAREVRDLTFGICTKNAFEDLDAHGAALTEFWSHSLRCAATARTVADSLSIRNRDSLFMAGLLHDIGKLAMLCQCKDQSLEVTRLMESESVKQDTIAAERHVFGFDHTDVGAALMELWKLPSYLREVSKHHHLPEDDEKSNQTVDIVHVADRLTVLMETKPSDSLVPLRIAPQAQQRLKLETETMPTIAANAQALVTELTQILAA